ncbi:MAG: energy-coupled thiamine transporter ThiT [Lachnospiraceae bacterium]|nr:energy-coupled thiamine transporter ThiT [Lachnospiraceae bacterium]
MERKKLLTIAEGGIAVALAIALSYLKIPIGLSFGGFGGSIDLVMVPIIFYAIRRGPLWGMASGLIFGTLKFFLAGGTAVNWQSMLLDYSLAYMMVGLAGLISKARTSYPMAGVAALIGCLGRFFIHFISGVTIYKEYMPEEFLDMTMTSPTFYSILYNGTYMLPNTILAVAICAIFAVPLNKLIKYEG